MAAEDAKNALLRQAGSATSALISLQLFMRLCTFLFNAAILRLTSPSVLGITTVKLELFLNTVLFLSREGLRMALLRFTPPPSTKDEREDVIWQRKLFMMAWLALPCSVPLCLLIAMVMLYTLPVQVSQAKDPYMMWRFYRALFVCCILVWLELLIEPLYLLFVHRQLAKRRIRIELLAFTTRALVIVSVFWFYYRHEDPTISSSKDLEHDLAIALLAYPLGQLVGALVQAIGSILLYLSLRPKVRSIFATSSELVDGKVLRHALAMSKQIAIKHLLAQGDMWVVSLFCSLQDQGVYAAVYNYGSLACRILLQPTEEAGLQFFSMTISQEALSRSTHEGSTSPPEGHKKAALQYLAIILKTDLLLSLFLISFASFMTRPAVSFLLGRRWLETEMPKALTIYCLLIPPMALSGILEAFMHATMHASWIPLYQRSSIIVTTIYMILSVLFGRAFGSIGLILANIFNFFIRGLFGLYYLSHFLDRASLHHLKEIMPHQLTMMAFFCAFLLNAISFWADASSDRLIGRHTATVMICFAFLALLIRSKERTWLVNVRRIYFANYTNEKSK